MRKIPLDPIDLTSMQIAAENTQDKFGTDDDWPTDILDLIKTVEHYRGIVVRSANLCPHDSVTAGRCQDCGYYAPTDGGIIWRAAANSQQPHSTFGVER